jgi:hypothetical protein
MRGAKGRRRVLRRHAQLTAGQRAPPPAEPLPPTGPVQALRTAACADARPPRKPASLPAAARAGPPGFGALRVCDRLRRRRYHQGVSWRPKTICADIVSQCIRVQAIATVDGIAGVRGGSRGCCRTNSGDHQHEYTSHHLRSPSERKIEPWPDTKVSIAPQRDI